MTAELTVRRMQGSRIDEAHVRRGSLPGVHWLTRGLLSELACRGPGGIGEAGQRVSLCPARLMHRVVAQTSLRGHSLGTDSLLTHRWGAMHTHRGIVGLRGILNWIPSHRISSGIASRLTGLLHREAALWAGLSLRSEGGGEGSTEASRRLVGRPVFSATRSPLTRCTSAGHESVGHNQKNG